MFITISVVQPMNTRSLCKIPKRQWPAAEGFRVFVEDHAAVGPSLPRPAARQSRARRRPRAAACRRARCPWPRAPARPPRSRWPQLPSVRRCLPGHRRRRRGALRLSSRSQPALRWRLAAARAGRPAPPAPPVGAPPRGRPVPRATIASLCTPPAGDCLSCSVFPDPRACVPTGSDLPGHTMDYHVKEKKPLPNGEKKTFVQPYSCSRKHRVPAARRGRSTRAPTGRHGVARVRWGCESRPKHQRQQPCRPRAAAPQRSMRGAG